VTTTLLVDCRCTLGEGIVWGRPATELEAAPEAGGVFVWADVDAIGLPDALFGDHQEGAAP
jgi:hypothetical protein